MPPNEVFLSHATVDRQLAEVVATQLRQHGVPTFYAVTDLIGAQQWQEEILQALRRCDWFLVILSPSAVESMWVRREVSYALSESRFENRIVPLMYRPCDLGSLEWLNLFQHVNFRDDVKDGLRGLLRIWGLGLREIDP